MNMLLILALLLCCLTVQAGKLPEFNDPLHGMLIVSRKNPPFLTLKAHPNRAFYVPTDQQVQLIRQAVYKNAFRFKRSSNDSSKFDSDINSNSSSRMPAKMQLSLEEDGGDLAGDDLDMSIKDFEEGMERYVLYAKFIGKMIIDMYKGYLNISPQAPADLPFESFDEKTYFKTTVVPTSRMPLWHEDVYATMKLHAKGRPYFPVEKIAHELRECRDVGYTEVSDKDFQFKSRNGGIMTYYKVKCMRIKKNMFVFFALNDNNFVLKSKTPEHAVGAAEDQCHCTSSSPMCWMCSSEMCDSKKEMFQQSRHLTAAQQKELSDYLLERVIERIMVDYKNKIELANDQTPSKPEPCELDCDVKSY